MGYVDNHAVGVLRELYRLESAIGMEMFAFKADNKDPLLATGFFSSAGRAVRVEPTPIPDLTIERDPGASPRIDMVRINVADRGRDFGVLIEGLYQYQVQCSMFRGTPDYTASLPAAARDFIESVFVEDTTEQGGQA